MVQRGMVGATGNIYLGLHEFADMGFVLHFLRSQDVFYDIGANVGTYTVLAGKVRGATCHSFEPDPGTAAHLRDNLIANGIGSSTMVHETALGAENGLIGFTIGLDTVNRVAEAGEQQRIVPVRRLDDLVAEHGAPALIKMDVEGHEDAVFAGARSTLADPMLLAIEAETTSRFALDLLAEFGFFRCYYDPFTRQLSDTSNAWHDNNALFVRDYNQVRARVENAPAFNVFGLRI